MSRMSQGQMSLFPSGEVSTDGQLLSLVLLLLASQQQTEQSDESEVSADIDDVGQSIIRASYGVLCVGPRGKRKMKTQYLKNPSLADDHRARFALIACGYYTNNSDKPISSILHNARRQFWRSLNSESGVNRSGEVKVLKSSDYVDCCSPQSLRSAADVADGFPSDQQWAMERGRFGMVAKQGEPLEAVPVLDLVNSPEFSDDNELTLSRSCPVARKYSDGLFHPDQLHSVHCRSAYCLTFASYGSRDSL